jgi:hypothetical protein
MAARCAAVFHSGCTATGLAVFRCRGRPVVLGGPFLVHESSEKTMKYPPTKSIFVDVDGTLVLNGGRLNATLVEFCRLRKAEGFDVILWSARGKEHALKAATFFDVADAFTAILPKPGYIVDDKGWTWTRFTKCLRIGPIANG